MKRAYKFRIYPNKNQEVKLNNPWLSEISGDIKAMNGRRDALESNMNTRIDSVEAQIGSLRNETKTEINSVRNEIISLRNETISEFAALKIADLEKRLAAA